jgi:hypothetical protein
VLFLICQSEEYYELAVGAVTISSCVVVLWSNDETLTVNLRVTPKRNYLEAMGTKEQRKRPFFC